MTISSPPSPVSPGARAKADLPRRARSGNAWTLALASLGVFLTSLDVVVVATALPTLRVDLHASLSQLEWMINAYNLVFACLMLTGAALGDRFGRRRAYVLGVLVFTLGSAAAALSSTAGQLIGWRVVQGVGAAVMLPLTLSLICTAFPPEKRGTAIGIWGGISGIGVAAGPVVGGAIVQGVSWHAIFWLNVPVGIAVAVLSHLRLAESHGPRPQLDLPGLVLAGLGMLGLTWAAVRAPAAGWGSGEVLGSLAAGLVLLAGFLLWERRATYPAGHLRPRLARVRRLRGPVVGARLALQDRHHGVPHGARAARAQAAPVRSWRPLRRPPGRTGTSPA